LQRYADEIGRLARAETLIDLGSGASNKTRILVDGVIIQAGGLFSFIAFEIAVETIRTCLAQLAATVPEITVTGLVGEFEHHRGHLPTKFCRSTAETELTDRGFHAERWWTDPRGDFGLSLSRRDMRRSRSDDFAHQYGCALLIWPHFER
jgi:uncharacterized SAM-dependent methyltransferase